MQFSPLDEQTAPYFVHLTFPEYAKILTAFDAETHIAVGAATEGGEPIALVLAAIVEHNKAVLLSIFTEHDHRQQGIATSLLQQVDDVLHKRNISEIKAYFLKKPHSFHTLVQLFGNCGWMKPKEHLHVVSGPIRNGMALRYLSNRPLPNGTEVFLWRDLRPDDAEAYQQLTMNREQNDLFLSPFREMGVPIHEETSVGLRINGQLVGWMINHYVNDTPPTVRYSRLYIAPQHRKTRNFMHILGNAMQRHLAWEESKGLISHALFSGYSGNPTMIKLAQLFGKMPEARTDTYYVSFKYFQ